MKGNSDDRRPIILLCGGIQLRAKEVIILVMKFQMGLVMTVTFLTICDYDESNAIYRMKYSLDSGF